LAVAGCSSGVDGFHQQVAFDSAPAGATVAVAWADDVQKEMPAKGCATPCSLALLRGPTYVATFTKEGCAPAARSLYATHSATFFVPLLPDGFTGQTYDLRPDPVRAELTCGGAGGPRG
jgi:hypothetical protein